MNTVVAEGILENFTGPGLGWIGGALFTLMTIATILLVRNMNMRIKRLPETFEESTEDHANTDPLKHLPDDQSSESSVESGADSTTEPSIEQATGPDAAKA